MYDTEQYEKDKSELGERAARELDNEEHLPELTICSAMRAAGHGLVGAYKIIPKWRQE